MIKRYLFFGLFSLAALCDSTAQTTLISSTVNNGGFESGATGWNIVNGAQTNQWFIGTNSKCAGTNGCYVGTASNNNNYTNTISSVVHIYRDFAFPAGQTQIALTFDFKGQGEGSFDGVKVYLVSTATTPTAGTQLGAGQVGNTWYNLTAACTNQSITLPGSAAGTTQRLVFSWVNDGSLGTMPAGTIDNVTIITQVPPVPGCATYTSPTNGSTGWCTSGTILTWTAPTTGGAPSAYLLYFGTNPAATNINNGTNIGNVLSYTLPSLTASTTYYWAIVPTNGSGNAVGCTIWSFSTGAACFLQAPGGNYTGCSGTFYDSGGSGGNYTNGESSTTTICPSVAGNYIRCVFSSLDLESCCDNLTIYNGPNNTYPSMGTYTGITLPTCDLTSSDPTGCLTFSFISDGSVVYTGWVAAITCQGTPGGGLPGSTCSNAPAISLPFTATAQTTACYGNDYTNTSTGSCGTLYESGEDRVYSLTVTTATCINIALSNASTSSIGYQVYSGCPGSAGTSCIASNGGSNPISGNVVLPTAGTYYIVVDTWASPMNATYDINITSLGGTAVNDLPCNASSLALNTNLSSDNSCSGNAGEPATPVCFTGGNVNSVWFSVVCPASGQLRIRTTLGTLTNTQIALFSGVCSALTMVAGACNNDAPACGTSSYYNSELTVTGLTPAATYYIMVDGANNLTGTFDIMAVDNTIGFPAAAGQDCSSPNPVCAQSIAVGNPGYQAYGNICDFGVVAGNCLASGERGSAWYTIPINANGNLEFDIVPNDWTGGAGCCSTDYDFAVWKIAGSGSTNCAGIAAGAIPLRCNYSGLGVTGCFSATAGNSPAAYPGYGGAYDSRINVNNGDVYLLCVSNFSNSTSGFTLNFSAGSPINYTAAGSSITWTGGTNTQWGLASNWGGCAAPVCGIDVNIVPAATNQPTLPAGNYYCNNITISPGATLTLQAGANLHVCGNFNNLGSVVANASSTITFDNGSVNQSITGSLVNADKWGNLVINKTGGVVTLNNNIDLQGSFTTSNATSVFNLNGKYMKIGGNFSNFQGATTVTNAAGSTIQFYGTAAQTYNQGTSTLTLNNVVMNHTGTGVTIQTNMVLGTSGTLTLTAGKIITNAFEVQVTNNASAACSAGNTTSFVQGNLRRYLNGAATSYDFPVGEATKGYQRANLTFTTATTIPQILAFFSVWSPITVGPSASECPNNTYSTLNALDNGYWTLTASANPTSGNYNTTLYSTNYTNSAAAAGWTVMKNDGAAWFLNGTCVATSTAANTQRTGMNGFSKFAVAQSVSPLPVELISFTGNAEADYNHLEWITASETNNAYFSLERSDDGINFIEICRLTGAGTTSSQHSYNCNDYNPANGVNYYRLKQVDYNGQSTHSGVIELEFHRGKMSVNNVHPNPTTGEVNFDFGAVEETMIHIVITDVTGRVVKDEYRNVRSGLTSVKTEISGEGSGIYSMRISEESHGYYEIIKLVKY